MSGEPGSEATFRRRRRPEASRTSFCKALSGLLPEDLIRDMIADRFLLENTSVTADPRMALWYRAGAWRSLA